MKISLFISRNVINAILLVSVVFIGLILFVSSLSEVSSIGKGQYGFVQAFYYVVETLPLLIYQIFPTIILIGVLLGLGSLASSNELTIIRTSGMSLIRISWIVMVAAILITFFATVIGEGFAPQLATYASNHKDTEQNNGQVITTLTGIWARKDNNFFHIVKIDSPEQVEGVTYFEFDQQQNLIRTSQAVKGELVKGQWQFDDVQTSNLFADHVSITHTAQVSWPLTFNVHQFSNFDPTMVSLERLYQQIKIGEVSGTSVSNFKITLWSRLLQPLTTLIMVLIAIPFVFGPLRSVSIGLRLLSGIMVGLLFFMLNRFFFSLSLAYQLPPVLAASLLPTLFLMFAIYLFWKKG